MAVQLNDLDNTLKKTMATITPQEAAKRSRELAAALKKLEEENTLTGDDRVEGYFYNLDVFKKAARARELDYIKNKRSGKKPGVLQKAADFLHHLEGMVKY